MANIQEAQLDTLNQSGTPEIVEEDVSILFPDEKGIEAASPDDLGGTDIEDESVKPAKKELTEEELAVKRGKNYEANQLKKQRQKEVIKYKDDTIEEFKSVLAKKDIEHRQELQRMRDELSQRFGHYDSLVNQYQISTVDKQLQEAKHGFDYWKSEAAKAVGVANQEGYLHAEREASNFQHQYSQLEMQKRQQEYQKQQYNQAPVQQQADYVTQGYQQQFLADHPWYNDVKYAHERQRAYDIDQRIFAQGYKPNTPAYWKELNRAMKDEMPYMFEDHTTEVPTDTTRRVVKPTTTSNGATHSANSPKFRLTSHQEDALIKMGIISEIDRKVLDQKRLNYYTKAWQETSKKYEN